MSVFTKLWKAQKEHGMTVTTKKEEEEEEFWLTKPLPKKKKKEKGEAEKESRRIFLIGIGESGKRTIFTQIGWIYGGKKPRIYSDPLARELIFNMLEETERLYSGIGWFRTGDPIEFRDCVQTIIQCAQTGYTSMKEEEFKLSLESLKYIWLEYPNVWDDWKNHIQNHYTQLEIAYFFRRLGDPSFLRLLEPVVPGALESLSQSDDSSSVDSSVSSSAKKTSKSKSRWSFRTSFGMNLLKKSDDSQVSKMEDDEKEEDPSEKARFERDCRLRCRTMSTGITECVYQRGAVMQRQEKETGLSVVSLILMHWARVECELPSDFWYRDVLTCVEQRVPSMILNFRDMLDIDDEPKYDYRWFLPGSQRSERRKWAGCVSETDCFFYVSSFSFSVTRLFDDFQTMSLKEDLELFTRLVRNDPEDKQIAHKETAKCVLIMTKEDILRELIKMDIRLDEHWPVPYDGPVYSDKASQARMSDEQWLDHCTESVMSQIESLYLSIPGAQSFVASVLRINPLDTLDVATKLLSSHMFRLFDQDGPPPSSADGGSSGGEAVLV